MNRLLFTLPILAIASASFAQEPHPWAMRGADPQRTGRSPVAASDSGIVEWKYRLPSSVPGIAVSRSGLICTGSVFNGSWWSGETYLSVLESSGDVRFRRKVVPYEWGASQGTNSSPGWNAAEEIITGSTNGQVIKLSKDGALIWTYQRRQDASNDFSIAILPDGSIRGNQFGTFGLSASGQLLFDTSNGYSTPAVSELLEMATGGTRSSSGHTNRPAVVFMNPDGSIKWIHSILRGGGSQPLFDGPNTVIAGVGTGQTIAFDRSGSIKWTAGGGMSALYALGRNRQLYVGGGNSITALNADTGELIWSASVPGPVVDFLSVDSRERVYATTSNGYVVSLGPSGSTLLSQKVCDKFNTGPAVGAGGSVLASGMIGFDHFLFKIR